MALKAYTLDLALQTSSEFAIGNTIPNVAGIATDGKGFIPTKNSINKTITLSKGFGKFDGRLFELTEQTVYSWDAGSMDADAYLVIDLTKQNSFTGTIEDGTYTFVDNQSSIVVSSTQPEPSANTLVYKLDGNYVSADGFYALNSTDTLNIDTMVGTLNSGKVTVNGLNNSISIGFGNTQGLSGTIPPLLTSSTAFSRFEHIQTSSGNLIQRWTMTQNGATLERVNNGNWREWKVTGGTPELSNTNLNTVTMTGTYLVNLTDTNYPAGAPNGMYLDVVKYDDNVTYQTLRSRSPNAVGYLETYVRSLWTSTAGPWRKLVAAGDNASLGNLNVSGKITGVKKSGKIAASGYRPAMNYVYNDFMVQVTLAGGNSSMPVGANFVLPSEIPAPAMNMTLNLGAGILLNVQSDRNINVSGGSLPGNFYQTVYWVPA